MSVYKVKVCKGRSVEVEKDIKKNIREGGMFKEMLGKIKEKEKLISSAPILVCAELWIKREVCKDCFLSEVLENQQPKYEEKENAPFSTEEISDFGRTSFFFFSNTSAQIPLQVHSGSAAFLQLRFTPFPPHLLQSVKLPPGGNNI